MRTFNENNIIYIFPLHANTFKNIKVSYLMLNCYIVVQIKTIKRNWATDIETTNTNFYNTFESLSIKIIEDLWTRDEDKTICKHVNGMFDSWLVNNTRKLENHTNNIKQIKITINSLQLITYKP